MNQNTKTIIGNAIQIALLELVLFPSGVVLYLYNGFNVLHVVIAVAYIYAITLVFETANLIALRIGEVEEALAEREEENEDIDMDEFSLVDMDEVNEHREDSLRYATQTLTDSPSDEPLKPEMKKALDEVFGKGKA
jgi:hypothetical protein